MRICIAQNVNITEHLGLSTYLRNITEYLANFEQHEVILISQKGNEPYKPKSPRITIHEIDAKLYTIFGNLKYSISLYRKLKELYQRKPFDIIHCIYPNSSLLGASLFKRSTPSVKIIYDIRSPWIEMSIARGSINRYVAPLFRRLAYISESVLSRYVDGFIFTYDGIKNFYRDKIKIGTKAVEIIPNGIDLDLFTRQNRQSIRNKYGISDNKVLLGYAGGIAKMRRLSKLLHYFHKLPGNDVTLMLVGDGDDTHQLKKIAKELNIQDRVIFTGMIPYERVPDYISAFDIGLCHLPDTPNFRYSFPMKILEYLACGIPVMATEIETHIDISQKLTDIYIYNSPETFNKCIDEILRKKTIDVKLDEYRWEAICQRTIGIYQKVI